MRKSTYCDLSSFGPALFEIWWPNIYLGGPYGPVKDKMYWPKLARQFEKCAGPVLMSRADMCTFKSRITSNLPEIYFSESKNTSEKQLLK